MGGYRGEAIKKKKTPKNREKETRKRLKSPKTKYGTDGHWGQSVHSDGLNCSWVGDRKAAWDMKLMGCGSHAGSPQIIGGGKTETLLLGTPQEKHGARWDRPGCNPGSPAQLRV